MSEVLRHHQWPSYKFSKILGPDVQSVVSLTSLLRAISLTILADSVYNFLKFFAEKMWVESYSHFFSKKFQHICVSLDVNFNESLTNDVVSFEQLGPGTDSVITKDKKIQKDLISLLVLHSVFFPCWCFTLSFSPVDASQISWFKILPWQPNKWSLVMKHIKWVANHQMIITSKYGSHHFTLTIFPL